MTTISKRAVRKARREWTSRRSAIEHATKYRRYKDQVLDRDVVGMKIAGRPSFVRIDRRLKLPEQRAYSLMRIEDLLRELGIKYWLMRTPWTKPSRIGILESDREMLLRALKGAVHLSHWFLEPLAANGRKRGARQFLPGVNHRRRFDGVRVFELVKPNSHSSFKADGQQGVEFHFWSHEESRIRSRVWNERYELLPDPVGARDLFEETLALAESAHADEVTFPIDVVYTWVDGADSGWQLNKAAALHVVDKSTYVQDAIAEARFADHDELRYSLRSIEQYAPWVNKIWIVTAGQTPQWLNTSDPRISIVNHEDIWPDNDGLPSFNSHAIEACLHRIPGLADRFLYFNDDFFLARPVRPEVFFHGNGISKLFYSKALVDFLEIDEGDNASSVAAKNARVLLSRGEAKASNFSRKFFHVPTPIIRSVLEQAESAYPLAFAATRQAKFRCSTDIAVAGSFYFNLAQAQGVAVPGRIKYDYIDPAVSMGRRRLERVVQHHDQDCIVVNDGSSDENERQRRTTDQFIRTALQDFLPVRSAFEDADGSEDTLEDVDYQLDVRL